MCWQGLQVCDVQAGVTGLRCAGSFDFFHPDSAFCSNRVTSRPQSDVRMPRFRPALDLPARMLQGSPRGGGHGFDVEVLDPDHVEPCGEVGGGLLDPVFAPVAAGGLQSAESCSGAPRSTVKDHITNHKRPDWAMFAPSPRGQGLHPKSPMKAVAEPSRTRHGHADPPRFCRGYPEEW